jgi:CheY-like chemotaxis protein
LAVEDNNLVQRLYTNWAKRSGAALLLASDGLEGVKLVRRLPSSEMNFGNLDFHSRARF